MTKLRKTKPRSIDNKAAVTDRQKLRIPSSVLSSAYFFADFSGHELQPRLNFIKNCRFADTGRAGQNGNAIGKTSTQLIHTDTLFGRNQQYLVTCPPVFGGKEFHGRRIC